MAVALLASVGLMQASAKDGGKGKNNKTVKVEGFVAAITDNGEGTATVTIATSPTTSVDVLVNATTKIEVNEKKATIADVAVGDFVEAESTLAGVATKLEVEADDED